jgi:hypothetical protein
MLHGSTTTKESISSISLSPLLSRSLACEIAQTHSDSQIAWNEVYYIHIFSTSITKATPLLIFWVFCKKRQQCIEISAETLSELTAIASALGKTP